MTGTLIAAFADPGQMLAAAKKAQDESCKLIDAFSPFPVEGVSELVGAVSTHLRIYMFLGGAAFVIGAYATEVWSALIDYPINSGGRPLNSWPTFVLFPFAVGIFGAALVGFIALLIECGLPSLHHPLFDAPGFENATQDRFLLALEPPSDTAGRARAKAWLQQSGALSVVEFET